MVPLIQLRSSGDGICSPGVIPQTWTSTFQRGFLCDSFQCLWKGFFIRVFSLPIGKGKIKEPDHMIFHFPHVAMVPSQADWEPAGPAIFKILQTIASAFDSDDPWCWNDLVFLWKELWLYVTPDRSRITKGETVFWSTKMYCTPRTVVQTAPHLNNLGLLVKGGNHQVDISCFICRTQSLQCSALWASFFVPCCADIFPTVLCCFGWHYFG